MPVYKTLPHADITCLDYSPDMMATARRRTSAAGQINVRFQQGDVGALPFAGGSFDVVLSLNGFHAFPDKEAAYREVYRVLKPGGTFCGCFYVKGENRRTDWSIEKLRPARFLAVNSRRSCLYFSYRAWGECLGVFLFFGLLLLPMRIKIISTISS